MRDLLKYLKDGPRGAPLGTVLTIEWVLAVQAILTALVQGRNITVRDGLIVRNRESSVELAQRKKKVRRVSNAPVNPWQPVFSVVGGVNKVRINLGSVNGLIATNWDTLHTIAADVTYFVVLNVSGADGLITGFTISLDSTPPSDDNVTEGVLSATFKVTLGVIKDLKGEMVVDYNLISQGQVAFILPIPAPTEGGEPFVRFWRWATYRDTTLSYY